MQVVQVASFHQLVMEDHPVVLLILLPFPSTSPAFVPPLLFHLAPFFLPFIFSLCSCFLFSPPPLSFLPHNKLSKTVKILSFICAFLHLAKYVLKMARVWWEINFRCRLITVGDAVENKGFHVECWPFRASMHVLPDLDGKLSQLNNTG